MAGSDWRKDTEYIYIYLYTVLGEGGGRERGSCHYPPLGIESSE